jgi:hypothetical protein
MEDSPAHEPKPLEVHGPPDVLGRNDAFVRIVIGEMIEHVADLDRAWARAVELKDSDPEEAMRQLAAILPFLEVMVAIEAEDLVKVIYRALDELEVITEAANPTGEDGEPLHGS